MFPMRKSTLWIAMLILGATTAYTVPASDHPLPAAAASQPPAQLADVASGLPTGTSFLIEDQSVDLSNPSAAFDSYRNEYWVVYQANTNQTIRAARLTAQGKVLDTLDIAYHASQVLQNPDLAYNSATHSFLVVWDVYDGSRNRIYGRILDPDSVLGPETNLGTGDALRDRYKPAVAYASTSDKFLVVWESVVWQSAGTFDVEGANRHQLRDLREQQFLYRHRQLAVHPL